MRRAVRTIGCVTCLACARQAHAFLSPVPRTAACQSSSSTLTASKAAFVGRAVHVDSSRPEARSGLRASSRRRRNSMQMSALSGLEGAAFQGAALLVLSMVVAIHELGHFLAARSQGIRVKNFSIGFGPKVLSYKGGRGVQVFGGDEDPAAIAPADDPVEYALRLIPVGGFVSFPVNYDRKEDGEILEDDHPDLLQNRSVSQRALVVVAGVCANLLLTWACMFASVSSNGLVRATYAPGVVLNSVTDSRGPAASAGLQPKDTLLSINNRKLAPGEASVSAAVTMIRSSGGAPIEVEVLRKGQDIKQLVQPIESKPGVYTIGVRLGVNTASVDRVYPENPIQAASMAAGESQKLVKMTANALAKSVTTGDTESLSGPVGVVRQGADLAQQDGALAMLQFAAVISVNLAVINSLPIPGLDGGQMAFLAVEALRGKKLKQGYTEAINATAILVLMLLSIYTVLGDLAPVGSAIASKLSSP